MFQLKVVALLVVAFMLVSRGVSFSEEVVVTDQAASAVDKLTPEVYDQIQARLRSLKRRESGLPRNEILKQQVIERAKLLDARAIQTAGVLKLSFVDLTDEDLRIICQLPGIKGVSLSQCTFTAEGFACIANRWHPSLERLQLSYSEVVGGGSIAPSAKKLTRLKWLAINKCKGVGLDVIQALSQHPIETIDMNRMSDGMDQVELLKILETEFKSLTTLDLHHWQKYGEERRALEAKRPDIYGPAKHRLGFDALPRK